MRSLYPRDSTSGPSDARRGSIANINPMHAKYKGIISTPGYCKFSVWKRESDLPRVPFSHWLLKCIQSHPGSRVWMKDIASGKQETFQDVNQRVNNIKQGLNSLEVGKGSVVCLWASNHLEYWLVALAAWELGAAVMPVNCLIKIDKLINQLERTKATVLMCDDLNMEDGLQIRGKVDSLKHILVIGKECPEPAVLVTTLMEDKLTPANIKAPDMVWDQDPIFLVWKKRGDDQELVEHSSKSLLAQMFSPPGTSNHWFDQVQGDAVLGGCWFFHMTGLYSFALSSVHGFSLHIFSEYSDDLLLQGLSEPSLSTAVLYPWQMRMMAQSYLVDKYDLTNLKMIITGGHMLGTIIKSELVERIPTIRYIREAYGLKETGLISYTYPKDKSKSMKVEVMDDHIIMVGLPNMWTVFKVIDRNSGKPVAGPEIQGELCVRTPQLMIGTKCEQDKFLDREGFYHTGDLGYYDKEGNICFMEQISNLINFWMYEVAPSVLESRLLSHGSVVDAAVVGVQDKVNGQIPRGFVVLKAGYEETEENLTNYLESRLQDHERLRGGLHYIQHIPRDENWKVDREVLKQFIPPPKPSDIVASSVDEATGQVKIHVVDAPVPSPRTARASEAAAALLNPKDFCLQNMEPQEIYGMRCRSRRGSQENILQSGGEAAGEMARLDQLGEQLHYNLNVDVDAKILEDKLMQHAAVQEVVVRGVEMPGFGKVARAYFVLKEDHEIAGEELAAWANSMLGWHHRLIGGLVITDRLPRDMTGSLIVNFDTLDRGVVAAETHPPDGKQCN